MFRAVLAVLCFLATSGGALAEGTWTQTFRPRNTVSYVGRGKGVLIAAAGANTDASGPAADALRDALQASRQLRVVMDDTAIGDVTKLDDKAIVRMAAPLPINAIGIVRVFPGGAGESAVVTFYDKTGKVLAALTAEKGVPLPPAGGNDAGQGVSDSAQGAVSQVLRNSQSGGGGGAGSPEEEYQRHYIGFLNIAAINQYGMVVSTWSTPFEGKYQRGMAMDEFYKKVGRPDYADHYRSRRNLKIGLIAGGAGAMLVGATVGLGMTLVGLTNGPCTDTSAFDGRCLLHGSDNTLVYGGIALMGVGFVGGMVMMIAGAVIKPNPVSPEEARELADEHNKKLRRDLGLPEGESSTWHRATPPSLSLAPAFGPHGVSLGLRVTF